MKGVFKGEDHKSLGSAYYNLGLAYYRINDLGNASKAFAESYRIRVYCYGPEHLDTQNARHFLNEL